MKININKDLSIQLMQIDSFDKNYMITDDCSLFGIVIRYASHYKKMEVVKWFYSEVLRDEQYKDWVNMLSKQ